LTIENLGVKLYQGLKSDRVSDSLGSSADGTNTGITLVTVEKIETTNGTYTSGSATNANRVGVSKTNDQIAEGTKISKIGAYYDATTNQPYNTKFVVYTDSGGSPSTLICKTASVNPTGTGWLDFDVDGGDHTITSSEAGYLWIGLISDENNYVAYQAGQTGGFKEDNESSLNVPTSFTVDHTHNQKFAYRVTTDTPAYKLGTGAYSLSGTNPLYFANANNNKLLPETGDFTIACWVKHSGHSDHQQIFRCQDSNGSSKGEFRINHSGTSSQDDKLAIALNDGTNGTGGSSATVMTTNSVTQNEWVHLACTRTGATVKLYINGTLETNQNTSGTFSANMKWGNDTPRVGRMENSAETIQGSIDDLAVWHRVLTATEIQKLFNNNKPNFQSGTNSEYFGNSGGRTYMGQKVATSSSELYGQTIGGSGQSVGFYFKKTGTPTGTAYFQILDNSDAVVSGTEVSFDPNDVSSDYTWKFFKPSTARTLAVGDKLVMKYTAGSASSNTLMVKYSNSGSSFDGTDSHEVESTSTSGTPSITNNTAKDMDIIVDDAQLVSSLANKSELKAYYSMDSTSLGSATYSQDFSGSVTYINNGAYTVSSTVSNAWNASIANTGHTGAETTIDLGTTIDGGSFVLDYTMEADNISNYVYFWFGLGSVSGAGYEDSQNFVGTLTTFQGNSINGDIRAGFMDNSATWTSSSGSAGNYFPAGTTRWCRLVKDGTTITSYIYPTEADRTAGTNATHSHAKTSSPASMSGLRYLQIMVDNYNDGKTNTATIDDIKIYSGITNPVGCANDFSSTSDLDSLTGVRTNSIFQQTDSTPQYWWYNGTKWNPDGSIILTIDKNSVGTSGWTFASGTTAGSANDYAKIDGDSIRCIDDSNGTGYSVIYDLGSALSNKWVARFKLTTNETVSRSSNQAGVAIGLFASSVSTPASSSQDSIAFLDYNDTSSKFYASYTNGQAPSATPNTQVFSETVGHANGSYWWCEMSRDEGTTTFKIFSDSDYSTLIETETRSTSTSDVTGLRYIGAKGFAFSDSTSKVDVSVSSIEVYDGVTSV